MCLRLLYRYYMPLCGSYIHFQLLVAEGCHRPPLSGRRTCISPVMTVRTDYMILRYLPFDHHTVWTLVLMLHSQYTISPRTRYRQLKKQWSLASTMVLHLWTYCSIFTIICSLISMFGMCAAITLRWQLSELHLLSATALYTVYTVYDVFAVFLYRMYASISLVGIRCQYTVPYTV